MQIKMLINSRIVDENLIEGKFSFFENNDFIQAFHFEVSEFKMAANGKAPKPLKVQYFDEDNQSISFNGDPKYQPFQFIFSLGYTYGASGIMELFANHIYRKLKLSTKQISPQKQIELMRKFDEVFSKEISLCPPKIK